MNVSDEMVEAASLSDAAFDGRDFVALGRADKTRYRDRSRAALEAALAVAPAMPQPVAKPTRWLVEEHTLPGGSIRWSCYEHENHARQVAAESVHQVTVTPLFASPVQGAPARDIGIVGPVDGMNNPSAQGPYFRIVLMTGDNQNRSEYLISKGAAEDLRDTLNALLVRP